MTTIAKAQAHARVYRQTFGADAVVFPHAGGRFPFDERICLDLADRLRRPLPGVLPALPVPAGGMGMDRVQEMIGHYGVDVMLLVGGVLYSAGERLGEQAREFVELVHGVVAGGGRPPAPRAAAGEAGP